MGNHKVVLYLKFGDNHMEAVGSAQPKVVECIWIWNKN